MSSFFCFAFAFFAWFTAAWPEAQYHRASPPSSDSDAFYDLAGNVSGFLALQVSDCLGQVPSPGLFNEEFGGTSQKWAVGGSDLVGDARHRLPIYYEQRGAISLEQCAAIADAAAQPVIGFAWGTRHPVPVDAADTDKSDHAIARPLMDYMTYLHGLPKDTFGCKIYVGGDQAGTAPKRLNCGGATTLCDRFGFEFVLVVPSVASAPAQAVCCQQQIGSMKLPGVSTIGHFWFVYVREGALLGDACKAGDIEVTKPLQQSFVRWGELVFFYWLIWCNPCKDRLPPVSIIYWYGTMWAHLCAAVLTQSILAASGSLSFAVGTGFQSVGNMILKLAMTQLFSFLMWGWIVMLGKRLFGPGQVFTFIMILVCAMATSVVVDVIYDPMYVVFLGHHPLILGIASFLFDLIKLPIKTLAMARLGIIDVDPGYVPIITEMKAINSYDKEALCQSCAAPKEKRETLLARGSDPLPDIPT